MTNLKIPPKRAIILLNERLDSIAELSQKQCEVGYYDLLGWCSKTWSAVDEIFGSGDWRADEIRLVGVIPCNCSKSGAMSLQIETYYSYLQKYIMEIQAGMQSPDE